MTITVTLLGTGSPIPSPDRAGPATLVSTGAGPGAGSGGDLGPGAEHVLVDAGRGVLMRLAALGLGAANLSAVLLTHLHSDHLTDLNDVITTRWVTTFVPTPLTIVGPTGTQAVVDALLASLAPDIGYRIAHHDDLTAPPEVRVVEVERGPVELDGRFRIECAPTDHKPVEPSVGYRIALPSGPDGSGGPDGGSSTAVVVAGDTVPCAGLDSLCLGADALVHTVIRKDVIAAIPVPRMQDTLDYHSSPEEAAATAARAGVGTLILTHYVPAIPTGDPGHDWRALAAAHFDGRIELGDDLHRVVVDAGGRDAGETGTGAVAQPPPGD